VKLQIVSDIHLEFRDIQINNAGADILCLAGDICVARHLYKNNPLGERYRQFFNQISSEFDQILYIPGNHEYYNGCWNDTIEQLRDALDPWDNIILMNNSWLNFGSTRIVGTTLWTDFNNRDPLTMLSAKDMMNDYKVVKIRRGDIYHKLRPQDTLAGHEAALETIKLATETWDNNVMVLGHHAPSRNSIHQKYRHDLLGNGNFCSNLDEFILSQPKIKLWVHGHVHDSHDYNIGETRILCNPRGYPGEYPSFNPNLIVEI
jgi:Icc-related predicted phosphoesterase